VGLGCSSGTPARHASSGCAPASQRHCQAAAAARRTGQTRGRRRPDRPRAQALAHAQGSSRPAADAGSQRVPLQVGVQRRCALCHSSAGCGQLCDAAGPPTCHVLLWGKDSAPGPHPSLWMSDRDTRQQHPQCAPECAAAPGHRDPLELPAAYPLSSSRSGCCRPAERSHCPQAPSPAPAPAARRPCPGTC